jgi:hypothetical protein
MPSPAGLNSTPPFIKSIERTHPIPRICFQKFSPCSSFASCQKRNAAALGHTLEMQLHCQICSKFIPAYKLVEIAILAKTPKP